MRKTILLFAVPVALFFSCKPPEKTVTADGESITLSSFTASEDYRLVDTVSTAQLPAYLANERTLTADSLSALQSLVKEIEKNGTADVAKCFIPRHSINYYKDGKLEKFVLVCFECEGVRFSNHPGLTPVKNDEKRIEQMNELKKYFSVK